MSRLSPRRGTSKLAKFALIALIFVRPQACGTPAPTTVSSSATTTTSSGSPTVSSSLATVEDALSDLAKTAAGANVLSWAEGGLQQVASAVRLPAGSQSLADVKAMCGADNSLHSLLQMILPWVPSPAPGINLVGLDDVAYAGIQDGCGLATAGTLPSVTQVGAIVTEFDTVTAALKIKT